MSEQMRPYVIKQGDYLKQLAFVHGFDAKTIWEHDKNQELRAMRKTPDQLYPGDILHAPIKRHNGLELVGGGQNRYRAMVPKVEVTIELDDWGTPLADTPCEVRGLAGGEAGERHMHTDGDGKLKLKVPVTVKELEVFVPAQNTSYLFKIGHLDPEEERLGASKRLINLGYLQAGDHSPEALQVALRLFQGRAGMPVTGELDDATRKALSGEHKV